MTKERSYADLADGPTTFDPEEQFDRDIDERLARQRAIQNKPSTISDDLDKALQAELEHGPKSIMKDG